MSAVYGTNDEIDRVSLWKDICSQSESNALPWFLTGDINASRNNDEKVGKLPLESSMNTFNVNIM